MNSDGDHTVVFFSMYVVVRFHLMMAKAAETCSRWRISSILTVLFTLTANTDSDIDDHKPMTSTRIRLYSPSSNWVGWGSIPVQDMWDLWWTTWHWHWNFSEHLDFLQSVWLNQWSMFIYHSPDIHQIETQQLIASLNKRFFVSLSRSLSYVESFFL
jgi:hypothetical protein